MIGQHALQDAIRADDARQIKKYDRIGSIYSQIECAAVIVVDNPRITFNQLGLNDDLFLSRGGCPIRFPYQGSQMVDVDAESSS